MGMSATAKHLQADRRPGRSSGRWILAIVFLVAIGAWWFMLAPRSIGGSDTYVVVSGTSMEPVLHTGDLVIAHRQSSYHLGEIVVISIDGGDVVHRLWGGSAIKGWQTKGINKLTADLWTIPNKDVLGTKWLVVPKAGSWLRWAGTATGRAVLAASFALFVVLVPDRRRRAKSTTPSVPPMKRRTVVLNSSLLMVAALGGVMAGLTGLDASVVGLKGWMTLPFTHRQVHPILFGLVAVGLLATSLPLIGLQVGREIAARRHLAKLDATRFLDHTIEPTSPEVTLRPAEVRAQLEPHGPQRDPGNTVGNGETGDIGSRIDVELASLR